MLVKQNCYFFKPKRKSKLCKDKIYLKIYIVFFFISRFLKCSNIFLDLNFKCSKLLSFVLLFFSDSFYPCILTPFSCHMRFTPKGDNSRNERLNYLIHKDGRIHMTPSKVKDMYFLRFAICSTRTVAADVAFAWDIVREMADKVTLENGSVCYNEFIDHD